MLQTFIVRIVRDRPLSSCSRAEERTATKMRIEKWMAEQAELPESRERARKEKERNDVWLEETADERAKEKAEHLALVVVLYLLLRGLVS